MGGCCTKASPSAPPASQGLPSAGNARANTESTDAAPLPSAVPGDDGGLLDHAALLRKLHACSSPAFAVYVARVDLAADAATPQHGQCDSVRTDGSGVGVGAGAPCSHREDKGSWLDALADDREDESVRGGGTFLIGTARPTGSGHGGPAVWVAGAGGVRGSGLVLQNGSSSGRIVHAADPSAGLDEQHLKRAATCLRESGWVEVVDMDEVAGGEGSRKHGGGGREEQQRRGRRPALVLSLPGGVDGGGLPGCVAVECAASNPAALELLRLGREEGLLHALAAALSLNPDFKLVFQSLLGRLLQGRQRAPLQHLVPGGFGAPGLLSVKATPFTYFFEGDPPPRDGGAAVRLLHGRPPCAPALLLELGAPRAAPEVAARLQRDLLMLSHIPSIVTIFGGDGRVLHQNRSSLAFMGCRTGGEQPGTGEAQECTTLRGAQDGVQQHPQHRCQQHKPLLAVGAAECASPASGQNEGAARGGSGGAGVNWLQELFAEDPEGLQEALAAVAAGTEWRGLVRVPARLCTPRPSSAGALEPWAALARTTPPGPCALRGSSSTTQDAGPRDELSGGLRSRDRSSPLAANFLSHALHGVTASSMAASRYSSAASVAFSSRQGASPALASPCTPTSHAQLVSPVVSRDQPAVAGEQCTSTSPHPQPAAQARERARAGPTKRQAPRRWPTCSILLSKLRLAAAAAGGPAAAEQRSAGHARVSPSGPPARTAAVEGAGPGAGGTVRVGAGAEAGLQLQGCQHGAPGGRAHAGVDVVVGGGGGGAHNGQAAGSTTAGGCGAPAALGGECGSKGAPAAAALLGRGGKGVASAQQRAAGACSTPTGAGAGSPAGGCIGEDAAAVGASSVVLLVEAKEGALEEDEGELELILLPKSAHGSAPSVRSSAARCTSPFIAGASRRRSSSVGTPLCSPDDAAPPAASQLSALAFGSTCPVSLQDMLPPQGAAAGGELGGGAEGACGTRAVRKQGSRLALDSAAGERASPTRAPGQVEVQQQQVEFRRMRSSSDDAAHEGAVRRLPTLLTSGIPAASAAAAPDSVQQASPPAMPRAAPAASAVRSLLDARGSAHRTTEPPMGAHRASRMSCDSRDAVRAVGRPSDAARAACASSPTAAQWASHSVLLLAPSASQARLGGGLGGSAGSHSLNTGRSASPARAAAPGYPGNSRRSFTTSYLQHVSRDDHRRLGAVLRAFADVEEEEEETGSDCSRGRDRRDTSHRGTSRAQQRVTDQPSGAACSPSYRRSVDLAAAASASAPSGSIARRSSFWREQQCAAEGRARTSDTAGEAAACASSAPGACSARAASGGSHGARVGLGTGSTAGATACSTGGALLCSSSDSPFPCNPPRGALGSPYPGAHPLSVELHLEHSNASSGPLGAAPCGWEAGAGIASEALASALYCHSPDASTSNLVQDARVPPPRVPSPLLRPTLLHTRLRGTGRSQKQRTHCAGNQAVRGQHDEPWPPQVQPCAHGRQPPAAPSSYHAHSTGRGGAPGSGAAWASSGAGRAEEDVEEEGEQEGGGVRWHEVLVRPVADPLVGAGAVLVIQSDVTLKVRAEQQLARVLEAEHRLLGDILPHHVLSYMARQRKAQAEQERHGRTLLPRRQDPTATSTRHPAVSVLFADIKGFTSMSKEVPPAVVMAFLNNLFSRFDSLTDVYGVYKVETIGDCYMVAGGLMARGADGLGQVVRCEGEEDPLHARRVVAFARAMLREARQVRLPSTGRPVQIRVGIHSGPVTSGVVGQKMPRFCLFGDTVNTAARMESTGRPGAIHVSSETHALLPPEEQRAGWRSTGGVDVKGKGRMDTYVWAPGEQGTEEHQRERVQQALLLGTLSSLPDMCEGAGQQGSGPLSSRAGSAAVWRHGEQAGGQEEDEQRAAEGEEEGGALRSKVVLKAPPSTAAARSKRGQST